MTCHCLAALGQAVAIHRAASCSYDFLSTLNRAHCPRNFQSFGERAVDFEQRSGQCFPCAETGPRPVFGALHQASPHGVEVNVIHESVLGGGFRDVFIVPGAGLPETMISPIFVDHCQTPQVVGRVPSEMSNRLFCHRSLDARQDSADSSPRAMWIG